LAFTPASPTETRLRRQDLLDTYGGLLTIRQREALRLQLEEDWSISELAGSMGVSRAAAHDLVRRGMVRMEEVEAKLGLCSHLREAEEQRLALERRVRQLEGMLAAGETEPGV
jgi:predicted DNA-binding protein YlxM (UPF0122 family)